jgi:RNA polymerase sigma factor FliA
MVASGVAMYSNVQNLSQSELMLKHAPLVKRIAHHVMGRMPASVQIEDLIQAGIVGLLEATKNFDASKGASFETFAGIRIRGAMIDEVRRGDWVPRSVHRNARRISEAMSAIENRTGREAQDKEIADLLEVDIEQYYSMLQDSSSSRLFSYEELINNEDGINDFLPSADDSPQDQVLHNMLRDAIAKEIGHLPEREAQVLALYYDEELNLKEIGLILGVSESRVSQIHSQATLRLRARLGDWKK